MANSERGPRAAPPRGAAHPALGAAAGWHGVVRARGQPCAQPPAGRCEWAAASYGASPCNVRMCVCAYVRMCVCAYVRTCVCAYALGRRRCRRR